VKTGAICNHNTLCSDSYCNVTWHKSSNNFTGTCLKYAHQGDACWGPEHCTGDEVYCDDYYICTGLHGKGQSCAQQGTCKDELICDPQEMECISPYSQKLNEPCGNNIEHGRLRECRGEYFCNYTDFVNFRGVCLRKYEPGSTCKSNSECRMGLCINRVCVEILSLDAGRNCSNADILCKSIVCGRTTGLCMDPTTPSDGTGATCTQDSDCPEDAYCNCNYKLGHEVCWGVPTKVIPTYKKALRCYFGSGDVYNCKGLMDKVSHMLALNDNDPCSGASAGVVSFVFVLLALAFHSLF
jgi:hypothetical protein